MTKLLTIVEASEALRIKRSTLRAWILRRKVASFRVGRSVRISAEEVERVLSEGLRPAREPQEKGGKHG